ncbi:MAG TPA: DUF2252 domain-containing protein, partial [Acidimicrobiales bacterium]|nr:DUF2252 domain-containing protein [Acidimicrobiales bacterium]
MPTRPSEGKQPAATRKPPPRASAATKATATKTTAPKGAKTPQPSKAAKTGGASAVAEAMAASDGAAKGPLRIAHVSRQEGMDRGRELRRKVPRSSQGAWEPPPGRTSPVDILAEQAKSREPDLIPIRHGRMAASPFAFYRGAAAIMAADLAHTPAAGLRVQLCGDAHLINFGGFGSPERSMVFDVNDFDETLPGPFEWDVKRMAASFEVAGRQAGMKAADRRTAVETVVRQYRETLRQFSVLPELQVWYARLDEALLLERLRVGGVEKAVPNLARNLQKAKSKDSVRAFSKLTTMVDGEPRIVAQPPLVVPMRDMVGADAFPDFFGEIQQIFRSYRRTLQGDRRHLLEQYRMVDGARKVVGVGSVGSRCFVILLMGRDNNDPLFLQVKEAQDSVLAPFAGKSKYTNQGQRVVEGQRLMQATSDIFLGWIRAKGLDGNERDFYVRQLWDWKLSPDPTNVTPAAAIVYAQMCGATLA